MTAHAPMTVWWDRLDISGTDVCRITQDGNDWMLDGTAIFADPETSCLRYRIDCAPDWSTTQATVSGWVGGGDTDLHILRGPDGWTCNGAPVANAAGLLDVDLGFTPASNTNAIRRLDLRIGDSAETTALWLDTDDWTLKPLNQVYTRTGPNRYDYASPQHDYRATLVTDDFGAVLTYPALWQAR